MELGYIISGTLVFFILLYLAYETYIYVSVYSSKKRVFHSMANWTIAVLIASLITKGESFYPFTNFAFLPPRYSLGITMALFMILDKGLLNKETNR